MSTSSPRARRNPLLAMALAASATVGTGLGLGTVGTVATLGLAVAPTPARAIFCANCSTFYQQLFQYAEEIQTQLNTAEQLRAQINQYNEMIRQGVALPNSVFQSATSSLQRVAGVYQDARSLGRNVATLDTQFRQQFQGYDAYLRSLGRGAAGSQYQQWSAAGLDNARTAMTAAGLNVQGFASEDTLLQNLVNRSATAAGRMQAIQVGNEIAAQNVQQLQKLRDLVATQITLQGNYLAQQVDRQAVDDAARAKYHGRPTTDTGSSKEY